MQVFSRTDGNRKHKNFFSANHNFSMLITWNDTYKSDRNMQRSCENALEIFHCFLRHSDFHRCPTALELHCASIQNVAICITSATHQPENNELTPMTSLAPALAANIDKIPVPEPTSRTTLSLNRCRLWYIEFLYVSVLTSSFIISYIYSVTKFVSLHNENNS